MAEGSRIHRMIQKKMAPKLPCRGYAAIAETAGNMIFVVEGRADGIIDSDPGA